MRLAARTGARDAARTRLAASVAAACLAIATSPGRARAEPAFRTSPAVDLPVAGAALGVGAALWWARSASELPPRCTLVACGPAPSDGARPLDRGWDVASWVPLGLAVGGAMAPSAERAARGQGSESGAGDSGVVLLQAIGLTLAATEGVKTLVPRHRPFASFAPAGRSEPWRASGDAAASFWSGHAALAFAAAAVGSFDACGAESRLGCAAPAVALHSLAASAAMMRVLAGRHHVSDVVAGGVVGGAVGSAVALAHAPAGRRPATDAGHAVMAGQGLALTMFFLW